jgi:4-amino-4-deoxy-L-arabinose transferase-like glycosyltransferase
MVTFLKKADQHIRSHFFLVLTFFLFTLLRIPNFFEPYWYGDEAIYLTIGNGLRQGERLYAEIIDHKTPIIYYLAMTPNQFWFRVLNFFCMAVTIGCFYYLLKKILRHQLATNVATFLFMLFTTLPWFEGHIPNGELFVMFFMFVGATLFSFTSLFTTYFGKENAEAKNIQNHPYTRKNLSLLFGAGFLFGLGILTKVPALFDVMAFFALSWFLLTSWIFKKGKLTWRNVRSLIGQNVFLGLGVLAPIIYSIVYFNLRGSGQAYLDYGLLYNFRYAGSWGLHFNSDILNFLFTLPGKALLLGIWMVMLTALQRKLSPTFQFIASWVALALFATTLSNRPYPHYFQQMMPPLGFLAGYLVLLLSPKSAISKVQRILEIIFTAIGVFIFIQVLLLLNVRPYGTIEYYEKFRLALTGKITWVEYRNSFNALMKDNYQAAAMIKLAQAKRIFIWGDNPMLYALSDTAPTGRFTVAFHIFDFKAMPETFHDIERVAPKFIVIMKNSQDFPELRNYLNEYYMPHNNFQYFTLWKRI